MNLRYQNCYLVELWFQLLLHRFVFFCEDQNIFAYKKDEYILILKAIENESQFYL